MEMLLYGRRLSFSRLAVLLVSMSLVLYLFYDFMSFQSKPDRGVNYLNDEKIKKMREMKDTLRHSDVRDDVISQEDSYDQEKNDYRIVNDVDEIKERDQVLDDADDDSDETFVQDGDSENILEEKFNEKTGNDFDTNENNEKKAEDIGKDNDDDDDDDDDDDEYEDDDDDDEDDDNAIDEINENNKKKEEYIGKDDDDDDDDDNVLDEINENNKKRQEYIGKDDDDDDDDDQYEDDDDDEEEEEDDQDKDGKDDDIEDDEDDKEIIVEKDKNVEKGKEIVEPEIGKSMKKKINAFRQALEYEGHLRETNATFIRIINKAKYISLMAPTSNFLLVNFVCRSCLPFVNSWLCNTKYLNIHKSVLFVARDLNVRRSLLNSWPDLNVVAMQPSLSKGDYSDIRKDKNACILKKLQLINGLLRAGINLLVFDEKSVWFENPVPNLRPTLQPGVDIIVNIVPNSHLNMGFLVLYATEKTELFWKDLYGNLRNDLIYGKESETRKGLNLEERYEESLQNMIKYRHHGVTIRQLPVNLFTDGVWYFLKDEERANTRPVVIRNNYIEGNEAKIQRAKYWNHWFLLDDNTCNTKLAKRIANL